MIALIHAMNSCRTLRKHLRVTSPEVPRFGVIFLCNQWPLLIAGLQRWRCWTQLEVQGGGSDTQHRCSQIHPRQLSPEGSFCLRVDMQKCNTRLWLTNNCWTLLMAVVKPKFPIRYFVDVWIFPSDVCITLMRNSSKNLSFCSQICFIFPLCAFVTQAQAVARRQNVFQ